MNHRHPARQHRHHIMLYHRARALRLNHQVHRQVKQRSSMLTAYQTRHHRCRKTIWLT